MIWLLTRAVVLPIRALFGTARLGTRATVGSAALGFRAGRVLGVRRLTVLALGVGIGLLLAPVPGRELRARLGALWEEWTGGSLAPLPEPAAPSAHDHAHDHDHTDQLREITGTGPMA